jgi:glutathione peroxidase
MSQFTDFELVALDGAAMPLSAYKGRVVLVVNVASMCGFTPQYAGLEQLWRSYKGRGLIIIGCPCDQFGHQEPGSEAEIGAFCTSTYDVSFPMSAKLEVNGEQAHPLWQWMRESEPGVLGTTAVKWNFTKFLIGRDGQVKARYAPTTSPEALVNDIEAALAAV